MKLLFLAFLILAACTHHTSQIQKIYDGYIRVEHSTEGFKHHVRFERQPHLSDVHFLGLAFLYNYKYCRNQNLNPDLQMQGNLHDDKLEQAFTCVSNFPPAFEEYLGITLSNLCNSELAKDEHHKTLREDCENLKSKNLNSNLDH